MGTDTKPDALYPVHIMVKPEGLAHQSIAEVIHHRITELLGTDMPSVHIITRLTPEQVCLLYDKDSIPPEYADYLSSNETEHFIAYGDKDIYEETRAFKGKMNPASGIRGELMKLSAELGIPFEKWQNFIHATDSPEETFPFCEHITDDQTICINCFGNDTCHHNLQDHIQSESVNNNS